MLGNSPVCPEFILGPIVLAALINDSEFQGRVVMHTQTRRNSRLSIQCPALNTVNGAVTTPFYSTRDIAVRTSFVFVSKFE
jgi:hypothetical protein